MKILAFSGNFWLQGAPKKKTFQARLSQILVSIFGICDNLWYETLRLLILQVYVSYMGSAWKFLKWPKIPDFGNKHPNFFSPKFLAKYKDNMVEI